MLRMLVPIPPDTRLTVEGNKTILGGCLVDGVMDVLSETGPERPFTLITLIVTLLADRFPTAMFAKSTVKTNVGVGACVYVAFWTFSGTGRIVPLDRLTQNDVPETLVGEQPVWKPIGILVEEVTL